MGYKESKSVFLIPNLFPLSDRIQDATIRSPEAPASSEDRIGRKSTLAQILIFRKHFERSIGGKTFFAFDSGVAVPG